MFTASEDIYGASGSGYWPTWRGPDSTGAARSGNPPITWSENENIKWKVEVPGESLSSPVIWENKIFFLTAIKANDPDTHKFDILCLDRGTGKILWQKTAKEDAPHEGHHDSSSFASYSPVTDGKNVWASFGSRGIYCYDMDGNLKWSKPLIKMNKRRAFGEGSSAALAGDAVIIVCDHEGDSAVFAFNKENGELLWQKDRDEGSNWATPVPVEVNGKWQVITTASKFIRSYDVQSGEIIWQSSGMTESVIPTPVLGFGRVFCMSGFRGSALHAIELGRTGDLNDTDAVAWKMSDGTAYVPSAVLLGDKLFFCASDKNTGIVSCYDAKTGKALYSKQRLDGIDMIYASFVGVGDRVYVAGRNGTVVVLKNSDTFEVLAANKLEDTFDATPAIIGDELYLKGKKNFYCIAKPETM
jgi:outer membrane protein assembly factor BamB